MPEYPYKRECDNCGAPIFVYYSQKSKTEYARNSNKYINYNNNEKPDYHQCRNWKGDKGKPAPQPQPSAPALQPTHQSTPQVELQSADQMVQIKEKITSITLSRTVSYKYGKAKEYATEKEEIMDSFTCGLTIDIDSKDLNAIERTIDSNLQQINAALRKEIWHKYKLKLLTGDAYIDK